MASYIFYKADGTIVMQRNYKDLDRANVVCNLNPGLSVMEGYVKNINLHKVDIANSTIVSSTHNAYNIDFDTQMRQKRNAELQFCDWTVGADSPLSDSKKAEWQTYRQALRDLPSTTSATVYRDIVWPTKPS